MAVGSIYIARFNYLHLGQACQFVLHFWGFQGAPTAAGLANILRDNPTRQWTPLMSNQCRFTSINVKEITGDATDQSIRVSPPNEIGTGAGSCPLPELAVLWTLRTAMNTKNGRGRLYVGGLEAHHISNGFLTSSGQISHETRANNIRVVYGQGGSNATYRWVIYSYKLGGLNPPVNTPFKWSVNQIIVQSQPARVRSRKIGVGT